MSGAASYEIEGGDAISLTAVGQDREESASELEYSWSTDPAAEGSYSADDGTTTIWTAPAATQQIQNVDLIVTVSDFGGLSSTASVSVEIDSADWLNATIQDSTYLTATPNVVLNSQNVGVGILWSLSPTIDCSGGANAVDARMARRNLHADYRGTRLGNPRRGQDRFPLGCRPIRPRRSVSLRHMWTSTSKANDPLRRTAGASISSLLWSDRSGMAVGAIARHTGPGRE